MNIGKEVKAEIYGVSHDLLDNTNVIRSIVTQAIKEANMTLIELYIHKFNPIGVTAVAVLAESHLAIHTWPEIGYAAIDCFTCGELGNPQKAVDYMIDFLRPMKTKVSKIDRGDKRIADFYSIKRDYR